MKSVTWHPGMTLKDMERKIIEKSMRIHGNKRVKVAADLGVCLRTVDNRIREYAEEDAKKKSLNG